MIYENIIKENLIELRESMEDKFNLKSYIEKRLKQYSDDHDNNFEELKQYFSDNVDVNQPTNAQEEEESYMKLLHDFLNSEGY